MISNFKWLAPIAAFCVLAAFSFVTTRADDTAPDGGVTATDTGNLTVTVNDDAGKPVTGARVSVLAKKPLETPTTQPQAKGGKNKNGKNGKAVAQGTTDDQGTVTLSGIPAGDYRVAARLKGGGRGTENVTIEAGKTATVTITLKAPEAAPAQ
jgi:hypothetical protein